MPTRLIGCSARDPRVLHVEDRDLDRRRAAPAVRLRPVDADPAALREPRLPAAAELDLVGDVLEARRDLDVLGEPRPHLEGERVLVGCEREIHALQVPEPFALVVHERLVQRALVVGRERPVGVVAARPHEAARRRRRGRGGTSGARACASRSCSCPSSAGRAGSARSAAATSGRSRPARRASARTPTGRRPRRRRARGRPSPGRRPGRRERRRPPRARRPAPSAAPPRSGPAGKFSPSTRIQSALRPAK